MVRTNVVLNPSLLGKAKQATGLRTIRGVIDYALKELVRHRGQRNILKLRGKVAWEGDLSEMRRGRSL